MVAGLSTHESTAPAHHKSHRNLTLTSRSRVTYPQNPESVSCRPKAPRHISSYYNPSSLCWRSLHDRSRRKSEPVRPRNSSTGSSSVRDILKTNMPLNQAFWNMLNMYRKGTFVLALCRRGAVRWNTAKTRSLPTPACASLPTLRVVLSRSSLLGVPLFHHSKNFPPPQGIKVTFCKKQDTHNTLKQVWKQLL